MSTIEFTYEELGIILEAVYDAKNEYERRVLKYISDKNAGPDYHKEIYRPMKNKFDEIRNKCKEHRALMRAARDKKIEESSIRKQ